MAEERCPICGHAGRYFTGRVSREGAQQAHCDICGSTWRTVPASTRRAFLQFREQARLARPGQAAGEEDADG